MIVAHSLFVPLVVIGVIILLWVLTKAYIKRPNEGVVFQRLGTYKGVDVSGSGLRMTYPLVFKKRVNMKSQVLSTSTLKVVESRGNPVEASANFKIQVREPAKAVFVADDYLKSAEEYCSSGLRDIIKSVSYDDLKSMSYSSPTDRRSFGRLEFDGPSSKAHAVANERFAKIGEQLSELGVYLSGFGLDNIAYAPEVAQVMLQKQQAQAIVDAKKKLSLGIVDVVADVTRQVTKDMSAEGREALTRSLLVSLMTNETPQTVIPL